jgi:Zn-dependent protease
VLFGLIRNDIGWEYNFVILLAFVLALLVALVPHEWAHGYAALKCGDPSAKIAGRLSLNPARHIEPLGLLCFMLAGIGWAKPVPVNPFNYKNFRRGNFLVSVAGVAMNFVIGFTASFFMYLVYKFGDPSNFGVYGLYFFFYFVTVVNISLVIFNLLPIYPLDGYNMLVSFTKPDNRFMEFMRQNSAMMLMVVLLASVFTGFIGIARDGIIYGFEWLWGLVF